MHNVELTNEEYHLISELLAKRKKELAKYRKERILFGGAFQLLNHETATIDKLISDKFISL